LENHWHVGPVCQWLCRHAACPNWSSRAASPVSTRAAKRRPRQHAPVRARLVRSHAEVTGLSALRRRLRASAFVSGAAHSIEVEPMSPCSRLAPSPVRAASCRRVAAVLPERASALPLPSAGKCTAAVPSSSSELVSCRRLATSALSSHQAEPCCSTKSAAFGHASCATVLVDQGHPRPQRHR
jgi:hypothetical protein